MISTIITRWMTYTLRAMHRTPLLSRALLSRLPAPRLAPTLALLIVACGGSDAITPPTPVPARLEVFAGADQRGEALEPLHDDIGIQAFDGDGHTMSGVRVTLAIVDGDGTLSAQDATSDAEGTIHVSWTLGPRTGDQHLRASVADAPSVQTTVTATASPQMVVSLNGNSIMLLYLENGAIRPLTNLWVATHPVWSPDGRRIAFVGRPDNTINDRVYVMNADGSGATPITTVTDSTLDLDVDWSPDGKHLVFTRLNGSETRIFMMDPDGKNLVQLTTVQSSMPRWSPDGTGDRLLTTDVPPDHLYDADPAWSADGSVIAFSRAVTDPGGSSSSSALYTINPDGTGVTVVSPGPEALSGPRWRP